jgi:hypothetical protein
MGSRIIKWTPSGLLFFGPQIFWNFLKFHQYSGFGVAMKKVYKTCPQLPYCGRKNVMLGYTLGPKNAKLFKITTISAAIFAKLKKIIAIQCEMKHGWTYLTFVTTFQS